MWQHGRQYICTRVASFGHCPGKVSLMLPPEQYVRRAISDLSLKAHVTSRGHMRLKRKLSFCMRPCSSQRKGSRDWIHRKVTSSRSRGEDHPQSMGLTVSNLQRTWTSAQKAYCMLISIWMTFRRQRASWMCVVIMEDPIFSGSELILWLKIMFDRSNLYREYLVMGTA